MTTRSRMQIRCVTLALLGVHAFSSAQIGFDPGPVVARDVAPAKGVAILDAKAAELANAAASAAQKMGARLGRSPRGNTVIALRVSLSKLDDYCIYPVFFSKNGDPNGTFALFQKSVAERRPKQIGFTGLSDSNWRRVAAELNGDVLLEITTEELDATHTRFTFASNCVADTSLGRVLANSTGKFERAFLSRVAPQPNLDPWTKATTVSSQAIPELEYRARSEFDHADIHRSVLRRLHTDSSDTLVKAETAAKVDDVWRAAIRVTERFAELRSLPITDVNDQMKRIRNGDASAGGSDREWREEISTTLTDLGDGRTRISVMRRLFVASPDHLWWRGYASDGEMESWIITAIRNELPTITAK